MLSHLFLTGFLAKHRRLCLLNRVTVNSKLGEKEKGLPEQRIWIFGFFDHFVLLYIYFLCVPLQTSTSAGIWNIYFHVADDADEKTVGHIGCEESSKGDLELQQAIALQEKYLRLLFLYHASN